MKSPANESTNPVNKVQVLHPMHAIPTINDLLNLSAARPPKMPIVDRDAVKANPDSKPYHSSKAG